MTWESWLTAHFRYCMYGSSANLVISTGRGVNGYTLDNVSESLAAWDS